MKYPAILAAILMSVAVGCDDSSPSVGTPLTVPLVTRNGVPAGAVTVSNSTSSLRLDIITHSGWRIEKVRAAVGTSLAHIPQTRQGQPVTELFPLRSKTESVNSVHFSVPLSVDAGTELFLAVYADVRDKTQVTEKDSGMEPAWGQGTPFPRKPEAMYFTYTVQSSGTPTLAGLYHTQTQAQWGGAISGFNAPGYLTGVFSAAFPAGLVIGRSDGFTATFTTARAIDQFLPQSGAALALDQDHVNPTNLNNTLAGETLALALNVGFDDFDPDFSAGVTSLGDLVVADPSSLCFGVRVRDVLAMANQMLAGLGDTLGMSPDELMDVVHRINLNFEDAVADQGYLGLP